MLIGNRPNVKSKATINRANLVKIETESDFKRPEIKIGTVNVQSLCNKYDTIRHILSESRFDILTITESWLTENSNYEALEACPPNFEIIR